MPWWSLLDCIRKSVSLTKLCSIHKLYLCIRSTDCQNFKTIGWLPTEITVIEEKQKITYGFYSNSLLTTKFCWSLLHVWALTSRNFRENTACRSSVMSRDPKSVKSLARVWLCVGLVFSVSHCCIPWSLTQINTTFAVYSINNYKTVTLANTASAMKTTQR